MRLYNLFATENGDQKGLGHQSLCPFGHNHHISFANRSIYSAEQPGLIYKLFSVHSLLNNCMVVEVFPAPLGPATTHKVGFSFFPMPLFFSHFLDRFLLTAYGRDSLAGFLHHAFQDFLGIGRLPASVLGHFFHKGAQLFVGRLFH